MSAKHAIDIIEHSSDKSAGLSLDIGTGGIMDWIPRGGGLGNVLDLGFYVHQPDLDYVSAIAKTISYPEANTIKQAVKDFISRECRVQVALESRGIRFSLNFNIPYLILRQQAPNHEFHAPSNPEQRSGQDSLFSIPSDTNPNQRFNLYETQVTIVVSGWDNTRWVAYAFSNAKQELTGDKQDPDERLYEDYLATDGMNGPFIDANSPIWDPRKYWLWIVALRSDIILQEWEYLVQTLAPFCQSLLEFAQRSKVEVVYKFDRLIEISTVLAHTEECVCKAGRAWAKFADADGDANFFSDMTSDLAMKSMRDIRNAFQSLKLLEAKLESLSKSCKASSEVIKLQLEAENTRINQQAYALNLQTNIISRKVLHLHRKGTEASIEIVKLVQETSKAARTSVLLLWLAIPLVLVILYFGAERPIFNFERTTGSFIMALSILMFTRPFITFLLDWVRAFWENMRIKLKIRKNTSAGDHGEKDY
ncbi:hypothetical protein CC86DRAFT_467526 [Ophiobolus disseminans]|uniref:Cora-domain-containing protein n=1 Tax=Ophiobolus disseminans TaxID=1469910 RepID=A0A6A6ZY00_9PLEO|nr:hypothetical protein CC86DRAFT_467526 [Ophiobolus disseminans]